MVFDAARGRAVLFGGGSTAGGPQRHVGVGRSGLDPAARHRSIASMVSRAGLRFGTQPRSLVWRQARQWSRAWRYLVVGRLPPGRLFQPSAYVSFLTRPWLLPTSRRWTAFRGGVDSSNVVFCSNLAPTASTGRTVRTICPAARYCTAMSYDVVRCTIVLFGWALLVQISAWGTRGSTSKQIHLPLMGGRCSRSPQRVADNCDTCIGVSRGDQALAKLHPTSPAPPGTKVEFHPKLLKTIPRSHFSRFPMYGNGATTGEHKLFRALVGGGGGGTIPILAHTGNSAQHDNSPELQHHSRGNSPPTPTRGADHHECAVLWYHVDRPP